MAGWGGGGSSGLGLGGVRVWCGPVGRREGGRFQPREVREEEKGESKKEGIMESLLFTSTFYEIIYQNTG